MLTICAACKSHPQVDDRRKSLLGCNEPDASRSSRGEVARGGRRAAWFVRAAQGETANASYRTQPGRAALRHPGKLLFLTHCSFQATAVNSVDDNMDGPNAYTPCGCSCSAETAINMRVSASLDDAEGRRPTDPEGVTDLDLGGAIVGVRFRLACHPARRRHHPPRRSSSRPGGRSRSTTRRRSTSDVFAEAADNAPPFAANVVNNLGTLPRTSASTGWKVPPWNVADSGTAQFTTDLGAILREVIGAARLAVRQRDHDHLRRRRRTAPGRILRR